MPACSSLNSVSTAARPLATRPHGLIRSPSVAQHLAMPEASSLFHAAANAAPTALIAPSSPGPVPAGDHPPTIQAIAHAAHKIPDARFIEVSQKDAHASGFNANRTRRRG